MKSCEYNDATMQECGRALCKSQVYASPVFVRSSNNFCNSSYTTEISYAYRLDLGVIQYGEFENEAKITAGCVAIGEIFYQLILHSDFNICDN